MRASNTTPVIVLRFEADSEEMLKKISDEFKIILKKYIKDKLISFNWFRSNCILNSCSDD